MLQDSVEKGLEGHGVPPKVILEDAVVNKEADQSINADHLNHPETMAVKDWIGTPAA
jgi:hypothetical protein